MRSFIKVTVLLVYSFLIVLVPEKLNVYTIVINCLGLTVSTSACTLLLSFLNSRPTEQKNFMNRILVLAAFNNHLLGTRHFILSLAAFFFNSKLKLFVVTYPLVAAAFLSERCYLIIGAALLCSLSGGRLLLYVRPAVFHNIPPTAGAAVACAVAFSITVLEFLIEWLTCLNHLRSIRMANVLAETGLQGIFYGKMNGNQSKFDIEETSNNTSKTIDIGQLRDQYEQSYLNISMATPLSPDLLNEMEKNLTYFTGPKNSSGTFFKDNSHSGFNIVHLLGILFLLLEVARPVYVIRKEYIKSRKERKVVPTISHRKRNVEKNQVQSNRQRSDSLPRKPRISKKYFQRRLSLQNIFDRKHTILKVEGTREGISMMNGSRGGISKTEGTKEGISKTEGTSEDISKMEVTRGGISKIKETREGVSKMEGTKEGISKMIGTRGGIYKMNGTRGGISKTEGTKEGISKTEGTREGISKTEGTREGISKTEGTRGGISKTEGTREDISKMEGTRGGISKIKGTRDGISKMEGTKEGISKTKGTREGISKTGGTRGGVSKMEGTRGGISKMEGTKEGKSKMEGKRQGISMIEGTRDGLSKIEGTREDISMIEGTREGISKMEGTSVYPK